LFGMKAYSVLLVMVVALVVAGVRVRAGEISTSTENGETVAIWNGKEIFKGTTEGGVKAVASTVNGEEFGAVIASDGTVLWESEAGAAGKIGMVRPDIEKLMKTAGAKNAVEVRSTNGETVVKYQGKEVWRGKTSGEVSSGAKTVDGKA
jgi:hypothetical protein